MGRDCSTPNTRFSFLLILEKKHKKCVFGVPCTWCEIRKIGQQQIHVKFTFTRISVYGRKHACINKYSSNARCSFFVQYFSPIFQWLSNYLKKNLELFFRPKAEKIPFREKSIWKHIIAAFLPETPQKIFRLWLIIKWCFILSFYPHWCIKKGHFLQWK